GDSGGGGESIIRRGRGGEIETERKRAAGAAGVGVGDHQEIGSCAGDAEANQRLRGDRSAGGNITAGATAANKSEGSWSTRVSRYNCGVAAEARIGNHVTCARGDKFEPHTAGDTVIGARGRRIIYVGVFRGLRGVFGHAERSSGAACANEDG